MSAFALADLGGYSHATLAQNESAFPPSPRAITAGQAALQRSHLYPDPDWTDLRQTLAPTYDVDAAAILCGAGSMDLIACMVAAFAGAGDEVLGTRFAYNFIASAPARAGAHYVQAEEEAFTVSVDALLDCVTSRTRIVFVCNPGNPTGTRIPNADLERLRARLPPDVLLVIDQAYGEFDDQSPRPIFDLANRGDTVVLRTLSKAYALAGERIGWGVFPPAVAAEVRKVQNSNGVGTVALAMAKAALDDQPYLRDAVAKTAAIRDRFASALRAAGYPVPASHTNFVLIPFSDSQSAQAKANALRDHGIILRQLGGYGLPHCLRATIGPQDVMEKALAILRA
ncbi:MAG: aminotransferase [Mesorhizobium amorphae]|nr:MAG: aminotransferase [Mesorhizobium amorphae]